MTAWRMQSVSQRIYNLRLLIICKALLRKKQLLPRIYRQDCLRGFFGSIEEYTFVSNGEGVVGCEVVYRNPPE